MSGQCPVLHDFSMMDEEFVKDPYVISPILRQHPVYYAPELDAYLVTRYTDVAAILPDTEHFSNSNTNVPIHPPSQEALKVLADGDVHLPPNLINADPPRHTQVRKYVADAMSPRRIRALEPIVREWATEQIDAMVAEGHGDIFKDLAFPLPALTGFSLIGFPREDLEKLKAWCDRRITFTYGRASAEDQVRVAENVAAFWKYTNEFVAERMKNPVDDFTSEMVRRHFENPDSFTPRDIATVLFGMSLAAHETTTNLILNGIRRLLENREQWEEIVADRSLIPGAVEESLRHDAPVIGWRRRAKQDVEIGGTTIPKDATVLMLFFTANRDPERFADPDVFDIHRTDARHHITFGKGVHFCAGAPLARMEMRIVLELLTEKAPHIRLVPGQKLEFTPNIALRGPSSLLVDLTPLPASAGGESGR
jgi:Cytochrome P450